MSSSDSHDPPPDSGAVLSREVMTPRGGFMARPGLKPPPRHAVVVRGGDVPVQQAIPVARSSFPPPAPSEAGPDSLSDKVTLKAIPMAKVPRFASVVFDEPPPPRVSSELPPRFSVDSAPPPSDAPLAHSIPPEVPAPTWRRKGSGGAVLLAGAAGLLLGLGSVLATRASDEDARANAAAPAVAQARPELPTTSVAAVTTAAPELPSPSAVPPVRTSAGAASSAKPPVPPVKKTIF